MLKDYLGLDLNDDQLITGTSFSRNASYQRAINWSDFSQSFASGVCAYDGVNTQAICSILMPEYQKSRVPSDASIRCGLVCKQQNVSLVSNASGNAALLIQPQYACYSSGWVSTYNDATFSATTWAQTPSATTQPGPLAALTTVQSYRVTACSVEIQPTVSALNNQGQITCCMNDSTVTTVASNLPVTPITVRDSQYLTYGNIASCTGHRLVYHNDSVADTNLSNYSSQPTE